MKLETFFEHFDLLTDAPNAAAKLREIILQLAVRGKLVSQDPDDEPASILLNRIEIEKTRIQGKKVKDYALESQDIKHSNLETLPSTWVWSDLKSVGFINPRNDLSDDLEVSFTPMNLVPQKYGDTAKWETRSWKDVKKNFTHFAEGDVAIAKITPCFQNGKSCVMQNLKNNFGAGTTELHIFRGVSGLIYPEFVLIYFKSPKFIEDALPCMTGTAGQKRVPNSYLALNPFPLPPLAEQKRIVEKVDRLLVFCDEIDKHQQQRQQNLLTMNDTALAQLLAAPTPDDFQHHWQGICNNFDLLYSTPETIPKLRQAILQLAVQGKLVPQDPDDEPASVLITEIVEERNRLIAEKKVNNYKSQPPIEGVETTFESPTGWACVRLGEITDLVSGVTKGRNLIGRKTASYPYLRVANVQRGFLELKVMKEIEIPIEELIKYQLRFGDILLTEGGDWDKLGRSAIWKEEIANCIHQNHVFRARPLTKGLLSEWVVMYTNSPVGRQYFETAAKRTTNLASINMTQLRYCPLPLPPLAEQKRIVAKVDSLLALCDTLETKLKAVRDSSATLMDIAARQIVMTEGS